MLFYIIELLIVYLAYIATENRSRRLFYSASALVAIYFSAFRNGLGTDYKGYIEKLNDTSGLDNSEPLFNLIKEIIIETNFSIVFFFALCAIITIWLFWKYLCNKQNEFASLSIVIFLSLPGLYFNTFNVVRQYFSAAVFLYSLKYIESKHLIYYALCIIIAFMMHTSAIILLPLYFVLNKLYPFKVYILFALILIVGAYSLNPIFEALSVLSDRYSVYLDSDEESGKSTIVFLCILINSIYFLKFKQSNHKEPSINTPYMIMTINMFILYTIFSLLTVINFYFYRLTIYFGASLCVMMPYVLYLFFKNRFSVSVICILFSFIYFFTFIITGKDNTEICSENMLSFGSLFDISPI